MTAEILVNIGPRESRAALLENGVLQEIFIERASRRGIVGNIYKGRVSRVLPGMQAAFVDAGLERTAFLHVDDIAAAHVALDAQRMVAGDPRPTTSAEAGGDAARNGGTTDIRRLVNAGDDIVVLVDYAHTPDALARVLSAVRFEGRTRGIFDHRARFWVGHHLLDMFEHAFHRCRS